MAITTLANVKTALGITVAAYDTLINFLIPQVESDYLRIRNKVYDVGNNITITAGATADGDITITIDGSPFLMPVLNGDNTFTVAAKLYDYMSRYYTCQLSGVTVTVLGYSVITIAGGATGVTGTVSGVTTIYPVGAELTAIKMIQYNMSRIKSSGVQSESLGDYSVTFAPSVNDYPSNIIGAIRKYVSLT